MSRSNGQEMHIRLAMAGTDPEALKDDPVLHNGEACISIGIGEVEERFRNQVLAICATTKSGVELLGQNPAPILQDRLSLYGTPRLSSVYHQGYYSW